MFDWFRKKSPTLRLVKESKLVDLFADDQAGDRLEASGVCFRDDRFFVIFDNTPHIAQLHPDLEPSHPDNRWFRQRGESPGFEDITWHPGDDRYLVIIEAMRDQERVYRPNIEEYDADFRFVRSAWVDFKLNSDNKGIEGLSYAVREGRHYVLGMCEGNRCKSGREGRKPGGGRIQVFQRGADRWEHLETIKLPKSVQFEDYASLDIVDNRIAVVSQATSALWVGTFKADSWDLVDEGKTYQFPRDNGEIIYGNIEGVAWMSSTRIVVVSDKCKPDSQSERCEAKDQSIHLFDIA